MWITADQLRQGSQAYRQNEPRDAMYKVATFLTSHFWGQPAEMANGLGVLLLTWNQAFYRYGSFDFSALQLAIETHDGLLNKYRDEEISAHTTVHEPDVLKLYDGFLEALRISSGKLAGRRSPVSASKALHMLCPAYFPLWDDKIAQAYGCKYDYLKFMKRMQEVAASLTPEVGSENGRTLLKLIDEYNFAKFTRGWV